MNFIQEDCFVCKYTIPKNSCYLCEGTKTILTKIVREYNDIDVCCCGDIECSNTQQPGYKDVHKYLSPASVLLSNAHLYGRTGDTNAMG